MTTLTTIPPTAVYLFGFLAGQHTSTGLCTCCAIGDDREPRIVYRYGGEREEWGHLDDHTFAEVRHIHVDSSSSDCDGSYSYGHVYRLTSVRPDALAPPYLEREPTFHDLVKYVFLDVPLFSGYTTVEIDTDEGRMRWHTNTDEGGSAGEARVCADPYCAYDGDLFRDHRAESMGY